MSLFGVAIALSVGVTTLSSLMIVLNGALYCDSSSPRQNRTSPVARDHREAVDVGRFRNLIRLHSVTHLRPGGILNHASKGARHERGGYIFIISVPRTTNRVSKIREDQLLAAPANGTIVACGLGSVGSYICTNPERLCKIGQARCIFKLWDLFWAPLFGRKLRAKLLTPFAGGCYCR